MSLPVAALLDDLSRLSAQQLAFRAALMLGAALVFGFDLAAGASFSAFYLFVVLVLAMFAAAAPDGGLPLFLVLVLAWHWAVAVPDPTSVWLVGAAFGILTVHEAAVLAAYGPVTLMLDGRLVRLWVARAGAVAAVTVLVWFGVRFVSVLDLPANELLFGGALLLLAGWAVLVGRQVVASQD